MIKKNTHYILWIFIFLFTLIETEVVYYANTSSHFSLMFLLIKIFGAILFFWKYPRNEDQLHTFSLLLSSIVWTLFGPGVLSGDITDYLNLVRYPADIDAEYSPLKTLIYYSIFKTIDYKYIYLGVTQVFVTCFAISKLVQNIFVYIERKESTNLQIIILLVTILNPIVLGQIFFYNDLLFTASFLYLLAYLINKRDQKIGLLLFLLLLVTGLRLNAPILIFILPMILYFLPQIFKRTQIPYLMGLYIVLFVILNFTLKTLLIKKPGSYSSNVPLYELSLIYAEAPSYRTKLQWLKDYIDLDKTTSNIKAEHTMFFGNVFFTHNENEEDYYNKEKAILETKAIYKNYLIFFLDHPWEILKVKSQLYLAQLVVYRPNDTEPYFMNNHNYVKKAHLNNIDIPIIESQFVVSNILKKIYRHLSQVVLHSELRFIFISPILFLLTATILLFMRRVSKELFAVLVALPLFYHLSFFLAPYGYSNKYLLPLYLPVFLLVLITILVKWLPQDNNSPQSENIRK